LSLVAITGSGPRGRIVKADLALPRLENLLAGKEGAFLLS